jgi:hypothetical protein
MTRDEARRGLLLYAINTVERFVNSRDAALAASHPGCEIGMGWGDPETIEADFMDFQRKELERLKT